VARRAIFGPSGFLGVEGTPAFGNALPFAGRRRNEGLDRFMSTAGTSSPPHDESTTPGVLEQLTRGGEP